MAFERSLHWSQLDILHSSPSAVAVLPNESLQKAPRNLPDGHHWVRCTITMFQGATSSAWPFLNQLRVNNTPQPILTVIPKPHDCPSVDRHFVDSAPIEFWVDGRKGVRLLDAQKDNLLGLADADVEVMNALGVKVTYKIEWPGYAPFRRQMNARRVHGTQCRARIAKQVARLVEEFFHLQATYHANVASKSAWCIGPGAIEYETLYLMELRRISRSTWVVALAYSS